MSEGTWRLGLLGHPVAHSLSPPLHTAALHATGQTGSYALIDCPPEQLASAVERLRAGEFDGLNATIPHKEALVGLVDRLSRSASALGAVNTLVRTPDGEVEGHNTDLEGLVGALEARWPATPWRWHPVTVVGAGGAARAAVAAAVQLGASEVRVTNRTPERAQALAVALQPLSDVPVVPHPLETAFVGAALVLQATSAGMGWAPGQPRWTALLERATRRLAAARPDAVLLDLVYRPEVTPWVQAARASGHEAESGLGMLVGQAAAAFACWTGVRPPLGPMAQAIRDALPE